ncbi:hypothetical protein NQ318_001900 [Aromia moschata]|uniref:RING-type E3 ubiquitin transferase n=1 Tax=Aromia moschata TaxID=1265417 RepID=A0AAV8Z338_9CUCU|nr:hypothetical protein NQ318_001900 [Aromia moschata]
MDDLKLEAIIYVPFNFTEMFRCIVCKGYLSVPPIVSGNNGRSVCGRCDFLTHNKLERRNTIYEGMARIMDFPCNFNKCPSRIHWGEVEHHEKVCLYREIPCPKNDCNRVVLLRELVLHFYDCHDFERRPR